MTTTKRIAVVGARGYTGRELCGRLLGHPNVDLVLVASGKAAGQRALDLWPEFNALGGGAVATEAAALTFVAPSPEAVAAAAPDVVFLALPNGFAAPYVDALPSQTVVVDLSADHRFDASWSYGLSERNREALSGATRIANPGCYATGMQLAIAPFLDVMAGPAHVFGVSGFSGAGTTPSEKNDPAVLADNLLAYGLVDHVHEREATRHLGHPVHFVPHVASWFRGIHLTVALPFTSALRSEEMHSRLVTAYKNEALVRVETDAPRVADAVASDGVTIGGATAHTADHRGVLVATIDNLAKGAAVQAVQNMNLALGLDETTGIHLPTALATLAP